MRDPVVMTLSDRGRDLTIKIKEMPALQAAEWCDRAVLALASAGLSVPEGVGFSALGQLVVDCGAKMLLEGLAKVDYEKARPLLDELLACCHVVIGQYEKRLTRDVVSDHIEDFRNIYRLRIASLEFNTGFSLGSGDAPSVSRESAPGGRRA